MKLLYLPNEPFEGWQVGARTTFERLRESGMLAELNIYSFRLQPPAVALDEILALARREQPDVIIFTKVDAFPVDDAWLTALRAIPSHPLLVYYDGDGYGRIFHRITEPMRALCRHADLVFLCGLGEFTTLFEECGAKRIYYLPHNASSVQFGATWTPTPEREFDVVLIGNRIRGRVGVQEKVSWARMSGVYERELLVGRLGQTFGSRFAVFGNGWDDFVGNRGPVEFARQHEAIRRSWLSVGYDHWKGTPFYFSDRLPISLMAGVAHVVHFHPGYDALFGNGRELLWADTVDGVIDTVRYALSRGPQFLDDLGARGREFASRHLTSEVVYAQMIDTIARHRRDSSAR